MARTRTSGTKPHVSARALVAHNGSFGQIWDKRLRLVTCNHKTIDTNEKVTFQGFFSALIENIHFHQLERKLYGTILLSILRYFSSRKQANYVCMVIVTGHFCMEHHS